MCFARQNIRLWLGLLVACLSAGLYDYSKNCGWIMKFLDGRRSSQIDFGVTWIWEFKKNFYLMLQLRQL